MIWNTAFLNMLLKWFNLMKALLQKPKHVANGCKQTEFVYGRSCVAWAKIGIYWFHNSRSSKQEILKLSTKFRNLKYLRISDPYPVCYIWYVSLISTLSLTNSMESFLRS